MINRFTDRITASHPAAAEYFRDRIYTFFNTGLGSEMAVCCMSGIAAGLFAGGTDDFLKYFSLAAMVIVWAQVSMLSGFLNQWAYIPFCATYLMIPYVFVLLPETAEAEQANDFQIMISDVIQSVFIRPMRLVAGDSQPHVISFAFFASLMVLFFIGARIRSGAKGSDFYCRTRLDQLK